MRASDRDPLLTRESIVATAIPRRFSLEYPMAQIRYPYHPTSKNHRSNLSIGKLRRNSAYPSSPLTWRLEDQIPLGESSCVPYVGETVPPSVPCVRVHSFRGLRLVGRLRRALRRSCRGRRLPRATSLASAREPKGKGGWGGCGFGGVWGG